MAEKVGIPVEQLSALKFAADLSEVSLEQLGTGLSRLNKNLGDIAGGKINEASAALKAMGIEGPRRERQA
jgi:hypothetical protein